MLWEWLGDIPCGSVRFWACADMSLIAGEPPSPLGSKQEVFGYASIRWAEFPLIEQAIQEILRGLARRALALWPHWYDARSDALALEERGEIEPFASERIAARIRQTRQDISKPWLQDAIKACRAGHPPLLPKYPQALQAAQLALSLKADRLHLLMIVESPQQPEGRLLGLVRVSEWLARHTDAAVAVIIPETLASHPEIASMNDVWRPPLDPLYVDGVRPEEDRTALPPLVGAPHPFSPGEKRLAEMLARDDELRGLFGFNQCVTTTRHNRLLVDLLWQEGRLVVEVDGYWHHGNRFAFIGDRQRDYELLISGYAVLRIPHDEIMSDAGITLEKIRDVVRFRRAMTARMET